MERQKSFSFKPTKILFISLSIPFPLLIFFWTFSTSLSSSSQTLLLHSGLNFSIANVFPSSSDNLSVPEPPNTVTMEIHEIGAPLPPMSGQNDIFSAFPLSKSNISSNGEIGLVREEKNALSDDQNGVFSDSSLSKTTISSNEDVNLVGVKKNALSKAEDSTHGDTILLPTTDEGISNFSSLISNGSSDNIQMSSTSSVFAKIGAKTCDIWDGKWVYDESYPIYLSKCPFIDEGFSCEINGRIDREYMKWRWQPNNCNIPRFNPVKFLELIRGKRLVFVGDSINRNQWESMMCLLREAIADPSKIHEARGRRITKEKGVYNFKFADYHCSVEYYVSHFLVHESKARVGKKRVNTLRIDAIDRSSSRWKGADILVFNSAHWWSHSKTKAGVNYYEEGGKVLPHLDVSIAFRRALTTWASWVDRNVNANKTRVFFRSSAPSHFSGGGWSSGGHCKESTQPLNYAVIPNPERNLIVDQILSEMRTPVTILNITGLAGLRIDGHPSVYGRRPGSGPSSNIEDCSHWCLPGVPDTWNEFLYFYLKQERGVE